MIQLTAKQKRAYDAIANFIAGSGRSPTLREIALVLGLRGKSSAQRLVIELQRRGALTFERYRTGSIRLAQPGGGYELPLELQRRLEAYCSRAGERPLAVLCDALDLHLDHAEQHLDELAGGGRLNDAA